MSFSTSPVKTSMNPRSRFTTASGQTGPAPTGSNFLGFPMPMPQQMPQQMPMPQQMGMPQNNFLGLPGPNLQQPMLGPIKPTNLMKQPFTGQMNTTQNLPTPMMYQGRPANQFSQVPIGLR